MNKLWAIGQSILMLALTGCSSMTGTHSDEMYPQRYTLPTQTAAAPSESPQLPVVLGIASVSAPNWLSSPSMIYRLEYDTPGRLATYSRSRWAEPPAAMIAQALADTLAGSGRFKAVTDAGDSAADIVLQVSLTDFEQVFSSRQHSVGILDARATLLQSGADTVLAQHEFRYRVPAPSADAVGGVQALGKANNQFGAAMGQWLQQSLTQCKPACLKRSP